MHSIRQGAASELWQVLVREGSERSGQALDEMQESYLVFMLLRHQAMPTCWPAPRRWISSRRSRPASRCAPTRCATSATAAC